MRGFSVLAAALLLAASAQSSSGQAQPSEPPALHGAVSAPAPKVFGDAVRGRAVDSAQPAAAVSPRRSVSAATLTSVPEPSSVAMLASGALGLVGALWRRRRSR
jgi:hypothetical protein